MTKAESAAPTRHARTRPHREPEPPPRTRGFYLRALGLTAVVVVVVAAALGLAISRLVGPAGSDPNALRMEASMGGFSPNAITAKAGSAVSIDLIDRDTSMHSDGGGVHSFHIDSLNVHEKVQPESDLVFSFTAPASPGTYDFYCDTCCGGKENPQMHGKLTVTA